MGACIWRTSSSTPSTPQRLGRFWEAVVGGERLTDEPDGFETRLTIEGGPVLDLCFQRVPEPPSEPPRLHLDLSGGARQAEEVERLLGLGARHLDIGQGDVPWVVLADPEGNPCCVMEDRAAYADTGPVAALPLDSADPDRDAEFWSWLTGWTDVAGVAPRSLRHPSLRGPLLELCPEPAPKGTAKNRLHLDVRLETGEDPDDVEATHRRARRRRAPPPGVGRAAVAFLHGPVGQRVLRAASAVVRTSSSRRSDRHDDLAPRVAVLDVPDRLGRLAEREGPVDRRGDPARLDERDELEQVARGSPC